MVHARTEAGTWNPKAESLVKPLRKKFGWLRAVDLRTEHVSNYLAALEKDGYKPASINRQTELLRRAFRLALQDGLLNRIPRFPMLSEQGNVRRGFFQESEIRLVMANLPDDLADFVLFGWVTGMRKGEIASLRWEDFDGDTIRLTAENAKNGKARQIELEGELGELIERRQQARQIKRGNVSVLAAYVFHRDGDPIREFRKWKLWRQAKGCHLWKLRLNLSCRYPTNWDRLWRAVRP